MTALTVSMPAYNSEKYIRDCIESVLRQEGVDFELVVVDDGSGDRTAEIVQSFQDPRVRLLRNEKKMGIGYCHNAVIRQSESRYIAHVDSDDLVLPGAFQKMIQKLESQPDFGQVHCHYFDIDAGGKLTQESFHARWNLFFSIRTPDRNYNRDLIIHGAIMNHLRTYRREVFNRVGLFEETLKYGVDYQMALRVVDKFRIGLVPEFLYCHRIHGKNTSPLRLRPIRNWIHRALICLELIQKRQIQFIGWRQYFHLTILGLCYVLRIQNIPALRKRLSRKVFRFLQDDVIFPVSAFAYGWLVKHMSWWPIGAGTTKFDDPTRRKRLGYFARSFPVLSETFIQREVSALRDAGLLVEVFAEQHGDLEKFDEQAKLLVQTTHYLFPFNEEILKRDQKYFFFKNPLKYLRLFLYVLFHQYGPYKSFEEDKIVFRTAVYLARRLKEKNVDHVHAPWANKTGFIALIASRLSSLSYSVQARAYDINKKGSTQALLPNCVNAHAVITNSRFNQTHLNSLLANGNREKIAVIFEGIEPARFIPAIKPEQPQNRTRILCVARLMDCKGLHYLLETCSILRARAFDFQCDIIGGSNEPKYTNYYVKLKKLYYDLKLERIVRFHGAQPFDYVLDAYRQADLFVLPCIIGEMQHDVAPQVLIEAMAMKLPVITTPIGAIPEIVEDGVSGILVPPQDEQALAEAILRLSGDRVFRRQLAENARKRVEDQFDISRNIVHFVELFNICKFRVFTK